ncbi:hypothetical protein [Mesorhizobium sangaii]|uniref:Uncharacterized protein n=1 Tax=Mesorhizobium sangaii TaxID=505389 RepID=A0A841PMZ0_9HYPH|nr:hypothetical protein [Mesorhizobium sangaii]MBB6414038.1 hypothetical protein [Mesorhizobium sangaii]
MIIAAGLQALTFASDQSRRPLCGHWHVYEKALQLVAINFHTHVRRRLANDRVVDGVTLTPREFEMPEMNGARQVALGRQPDPRRLKAHLTFHLENAKAKLGVRTINQAVGCLRSGEILILASR